MHIQNDRTCNEEKNLPEMHAEHAASEALFLALRVEEYIYCWIQSVLSNGF